MILYAFLWGVAIVQCSHQHQHCNSTNTYQHLSKQCHDCHLFYRRGITLYPLKLAQHACGTCTQFDIKLQICVISLFGNPSACNVCLAECCRKYSKHLISLRIVKEEQSSEQVHNYCLWLAFVLYLQVKYFPKI